MVFHANIAWALGLIALGVGVFLLIQTGKDKEICCRLFAKIMAYIIIVASILSMICTGLNACRYAKQDPHEKWKKMHHMKMIKPGPPKTAPKQK